ncbi:hypothetical protein ACFQ1S_09740 [Kibdelosporangium lantanae]|uniref:ABC transporter ATP-binding protein n=1 Tax=Kibdelosporangium lantanae TaxID=1497396 RepID=A0ABW3M699_9PSEU
MTALYNETITGGSVTFAAAEDFLRMFHDAHPEAGALRRRLDEVRAEIEETVEQVVIISRGQTMYYGALDDLRRSQKSQVLVTPSDPRALTIALQEAGHTAIQELPDGVLSVTDVDARQVGDIALRAQVAIYGLEARHADLEQIFFRLTSGEFTGRPL